MTKNLKNLVGRDLMFIDEDNKRILGVLMYLEGGSDLGLLRNYFFVPYDETRPFRIFSRGSNQVRVSKDHSELYGSSDNYDTEVKDDELLALAQFEGLLRICDPLAEIQGRARPLIKVPNLFEKRKTRGFDDFSERFGIEI
jgi:hypothetical protein